MLNEALKVVEAAEALQLKEKNGKLSSSLDNNGISDALHKLKTALEEFKKKTANNSSQDFNSKHIPNFAQDIDLDERGNIILRNPDTYSTFKEADQLEEDITEMTEFKLDQKMDIETNKKQLDKSSKEHEKKAQQLLDHAYHLIMKDELKHDKKKENNLENNLEHTNEPSMDDISSSYLAMIAYSLIMKMSNDFNVDKILSPLDDSPDDYDNTAEKYMTIIGLINEKLNFSLKKVGWTPRLRKLAGVMKIANRTMRFNVIHNKNMVQMPASTWAELNLAIAEVAINQNIKAKFPNIDNSLEMVNKFELSKQQYPLPTPKPYYKDKN